jgi:hypothetical protein
MTKIFPLSSNCFQSLPQNPTSTVIPALYPRTGKESKRMSPNSAACTGPRTEAGKAHSAQNAIKTGLFAAHDFIRPEEADEYTETHTALMANLSPEGPLEQTFALEIMGATWRLRRCRLVEAGLAVRTGIDPMIDDPTANQQKSVDRARALSHNILRRSIAELRKLQTERTLRLHIDTQHLPGLTDTKQVLTGLKIEDGQRLQARKINELDTLEGLIAQADKNLCMEVRQSKTAEERSGLTATKSSMKIENSGSDSSFCKSVSQAVEPVRQTPRNAPCPCNSGTKYKRCCGKEAPPVLGIAA